MTKKTKFSPKVKHKAFISFMVKLQDDDWMLGIFNPNDKTAAYFLAEPAVTNSSSNMGGVKKATKISGYMISALSRQGLLETTIAGLPRKFKTVEDATEWLEGQVEQYDGDEVTFDGTLPLTSYEKTLLEDDGGLRSSIEDVERKELINRMKSQEIAVIADFKSNKSDPGWFDNSPSDPVWMSNHLKEDKSVKKSKAVNKPKPATSQKFKTSKEELESLGLGELFDD